jgi:ribosomal protein S12 methylthiotransferase accessory factor
MAPLGITRVAQVTGLDCIGIPVVMVCRPNARSLAVSQGKGLDLDSARASGLMESIELHHAETIGSPLRLATRKELRGRHSVVDVERLPRLSISGFHDNLKILWIEGGDLVSSEPRFLPYEMVHTNYTLPLPTGSGNFVMSSNGLASGNTLVEAVMHGLCEVIERDATTLWTMMTPEQQDARRVGLESVTDPACLQVLEAYRRADVTVGIWDTTSDVDVASFVVIIVDRVTNPFRPPHPNHGMGCHPVREIALLRALTEAAQSRLTLIAGSRDDLGRQSYRQAADEGLTRRIRERIAGPTPVAFEQVPTFVSESFERDLRHLLARLEAVGIEEVVAVDLTQEGLDIPVARVVVPGLEPLFEAPGYQPGPRARRIIEGRTGSRVGGDDA